MGHLWINAGLEVPPEIDLQEAKDALAELVAITLQEPECFQFEAYQSKQNPRHFALRECFASEAALQAHYDAPYTQAYFAKGYTRIRYVEKFDAQVLSHE